MSRAHFDSFGGVVGGGCGKTGMGHVVGKLLVGQLAPVDEIGGGGGSSKSF